MLNIGLTEMKHMGRGVLQETYKVLQQAANFVATFITVKGIDKVSILVVPIFEYILLKSDVPPSFIRNLIIHIETFKDVKASFKWIRIGNILPVAWDKSLLKTARNIVSIATGILSVDRYFDTVGIPLFGLNTLTQLPLKKILSVVRGVIGIAEHTFNLIKFHKELSKLEQKKVSLSNFSEKIISDTHKEKIEDEKKKMEKKFSEIDAKLGNILVSGRDPSNKFTTLVTQHKEAAKTLNSKENLKKMSLTLDFLQKALEIAALETQVNTKKIQAKVTATLKQSEQLQLMPESKFIEYKKFVYEGRIKGKREDCTKSWISIAVKVIKIILTLPIIFKSIYGIQVALDVLNLSSEDLFNEGLVYASICSGFAISTKFYYKDAHPKRRDLTPLEFLAVKL
ncbi:MAG: hypothetical protein ACXU9U_01750 [Parachlamydiaceae bacterium]